MAQATLRRYLLRITLGLFLLTIIIFALTQTLPNLRYLTSYKHGVVGAYTVQNLPASVMDVASRGLTYVDSSQEARGDLAENWLVEEDGKKFTFKLRNNLYWQDGTKLKSSDLVYKFTDISTEMPDDHTIIFHLKNPISSFPAVVSRPVFKNRTFVGNGPYKVTHIEEASGFVKSITFTPTNTSLRRIVVNFYPTQARLTQALKIGEVSGATLEDSSGFANWPNLKTEKKIDSSRFLAIYYNTKDNFLSAKEARQALSYGINYESFPGQRATSPIPPASWAFNSGVKKYNFDPEKSKALLKALEYSGSRKVILSTLPGHEEIARKIVEGWKQIGIDAEVVVEKTPPTNFQAFLALQETPNDPDQYTLWHSTQRGALIGLKDARIDKFLEDARVMFKQDDRKTKYLDFQRVLAEDLPVVFISWPNADLVYNKTRTPDVEQLKKLNVSF